MIIECINCNKVFEVNSELIPENGRTILIYSDLAFRLGL